MARSRTVKPGFFLNEHLAVKSSNARLLFIGLLQQADCEGRLEDRPLRLKAAIFPYEEADVEALLEELASGPEKFIVRYQVSGQRYIAIPTFAKHQNPHSKERQAGSRIPAFQCGDVTGPLLGHDGDVTGTNPAVPITLTLNPITYHPESDASASDVSVSGLGDEPPSENEKLAHEGMIYLHSLNSPTYQNIVWVKGYLNIQFQELEVSRPNLTKPEIAGLWRDTCDLAIAKNAYSPQWFKTTFQNKLNAYTPNPAQTHVPEPESGLADRLLAYPYLRHIVTGEILKSDTLEVRPESPHGLSGNGSYFPAAHLEGLEALPADE